MREELRVNTVRIPEDRRFYDGSPIRPKEDWKIKFMKYFAYILVGGYGVVCFYGLPEGWGVLLAIVGQVVVPFIYGLVGVLLGFPAIDVSSPNTGGGGYCDELDPSSPCFNYPYFQMVVDDDGTNNNDP